MAVAYEGNQPYIFISYSHRNGEMVKRVIESLQARGFRVWFDGGIEAGSEWPEYIATHLRNCACLLAFISPDFVASRNCRRELNFAQDLNKDLLDVYIEDVELSDGMRMQLGLNQALWKKNYPSWEGFIDALCNARIIQSCRDTDAAQAPQADPEVIAMEEAPAEQTPAKTAPQTPAKTAPQTGLNQAAEQLGAAVEKATKKAAAVFSKEWFESHKYHLIGYGIMLLLSLIICGLGKTLVFLAIIGVVTLLIAKSPVDSDYVLSKDKGLKKSYLKWIAFAVILIIAFFG